jgi:cytochrome c oxidase subunit 2
MLHYLPEAVSTFAGDIDGVMRFIYLVCGVWFVVAEAVLAWFVVSSRRRPGVRAAWLPGNTGRQAAWVLGPVGLVLVCDFAIELVADPVWHRVKIDIPEGDLHVRVQGRQFAWVFTYPGADGLLGTSDDVAASELHVPVDAKVRFELEAADVLHAFFVPELRLKQDAVPGRTISGWFEASKAGTYEIACAEICGQGHTRMRGALVVEGRASYDRWLAAQN